MEPNIFRIDIIPHRDGKRDLVEIRVNSIVHAKLLDFLYQGNSLGVVELFHEVINERCGPVVFPVGPVPS